MQARKHTCTHTHTQQRDSELSSGREVRIRISPAVFQELAKGAVSVLLPPVPKKKTTSVELYLLCHHFISAFEDNFFYQHFLQ